MTEIAHSATRHVERMTHATRIVSSMAFSLVLLNGCGEDPRIQASLSRLDFSGKTALDHRLHAKLIPQLQAATRESLQVPTLVDGVFYRIEGEKASLSYISVVWIASSPVATGIELVPPEGGQPSLFVEFDESDMRENMRNAEHIVMFQATIPVELMPTQVLDQVFKERGATEGWTVRLVAEREPVSNTLPMTVIELGQVQRRPADSAGENGPEGHRE